MTREEAIKLLKYNSNVIHTTMDGDADSREVEALDMAIKALEQEPCCNCIEFKRYAKQMGFRIERQSIPFLMHKEMDIPLSECQKAYDVAIDYLRNQASVSG